MRELLTWQATYWVSIIVLTQIFLEDGAGGLFYWAPLLLVIGISIGLASMVTSAVSDHG